MIQEKEKVLFIYLHYYPEGEGPDGELIEMVEREMMERSPNVKFDDIAELEGAKNTLKEAVLLPLLMPDFFRFLQGSTTSLERSSFIWASWNRKDSFSQSFSYSRKDYVFQCFSDNFRFKVERRI